MDEEYDSIFKEFEEIECLYYEMSAKAEVSYEVSIKKLRRINELFENDEPKRTKALRAFFSVDFFTEWERKWEMLYRKVENADRFLSMKDAPYLLSGRLTDFFEYEYLWKEYSRFKMDEEIRQSVSPPQDADGTTVENKKKRPNLQLPPYRDGRRARHATRKRGGAIRPAPRQFQVRIFVCYARATRYYPGRKI